MQRIFVGALVALWVCACAGDDGASDSAMDDGASDAPMDDESSGADGSDDATEGGDASDDGASDQPSDGDAVASATVVEGDTLDPDSLEDLMAYEWELEGGQEQYYCIYQTLEEDLWVNAFEPIQDLGTHHVTLGFVEEGPPDGVIEAGDADAEFPCNGITLGDQLVYGAVFATQGLLLPKGVAAKIPAGKQLLLSVHVLNPTEEPLSGRTGISIVRADPEEIAHEAENVFAINLGIQVTPGASTHFSTCTMQADGTIMALVHHMHLAGVWQKTTLVRGDGSREVLLDLPFDFESQDTVVLDPPVTVEAGDQLEVECQFENDTDRTLTFGESTLDNEMCLTAFYRFPAVADSFLCTQ
jgi:hypothetical protein